MLNKIKVYNTLSGKKDLLIPLKGKKINLFVCGPTVYDFSHIGHARTYIIFDCFAKYLASVGFKVFYLQNITDIDDKIIARAREKGVLPADLAKAFTENHLQDMKALGITSINKYAPTTDYIQEIISQIERLMQKNCAYKLEDGIYFDISTFKDYGKLSHRTALQAEDSVSRIDYSVSKKNRGDFCLWKFNAGVAGEPSWPSPFGPGRPGWHIEDTATTEKFFGAQYDIHGGARDLIFPHHEAEVTLMETISGKAPLAKYWMHTGFLNFDGQKMSKSLGNGVTIGDFLKRYSKEQLRFWIAKNLWSSPVDYSESTMSEVKSALEKIEEFLRKVKSAKLQGKKSPVNAKKYVEMFWKALADDFNTPRAFGVLFDFIKEANKMLDINALGKQDAKSIFEFFKKINVIFGIVDINKLGKQVIPGEVKKLAKVRENYRKNKEWQKSDEVRQEIEKYGYTVQDSKDGPVIKKM